MRDKTVSILSVLAVFMAQCSAQEQPQTVEKPHGPFLVRSYEPASTPPVNIASCI